MKGLILKDFINLKKNLKIFAGLTVLYLVMGLMMEDNSFFSTILTMLIAILTLSLYSYDDLAKWDSFALTMPIKKDDIVQGKYIMMLLLALIGILYSSLFTVIINLYQKNGSIFAGFENIGAGAAIVILFYCIVIPFVTKLGVEKARLIFFAVYMVPFVTVVGLNKLVNDGSIVIPEKLVELAGLFLRNVYILAPILLLVTLGISYLISVKLYRNREF